MTGQTKRCQRCGTAMFNAASHHRLCKTCYMQYRKEVDERHYQQEIQKAYLRGINEGRKQAPQLDNTLVSNIIRLCHPDKHNGSKVANEVTQKMLELRKQLKQ